MLIGTIDQRIFSFKLIFWNHRGMAIGMYNPNMIKKVKGLIIKNAQTISMKMFSL